MTNAQQRQLSDLTKRLLQQSNGLAFKEEATKEMQELQQVIEFHEWKYYVQNDPVISDFEYDTLYKRLQALETQFPELVTAWSPTKRVSPDLTEGFSTVAHLTPMLSLENSYNADDLNEFDEQIKKMGGLAADAEIEYCVEPKFDGGTIVLVYENDEILRGATRGNGTQGEEITNNAKAMRTIPLKAAFSNRNIHKVELRGEALIRKDIFEKVNEQRAKTGQSILANPRNAATGCFKVKDSSEVGRRGLEAFVYQLGYAVDKDGNDLLKTFTTHHESIELLGELGFKVPTSETKVCKNIDEVIAFCNHWQVIRDSYDYEIDGMVVKVNNLALQDKCGYTSHHPRWAIAFKFKAKQATSKLINVEYQVGKVGSITPVAKIEPVQLAGVMVSSISLHNEDFIKTKDLRLGDTVLVERAGDVIPYIVKAMDELRDGTEIPIAFPTNCPACETALIKIEKESAWRCPNEICEAKLLQRLIFHVSKDAMDVEGFGKSIVERFYDLGWLDSLADVYRLDYGKMALMEGFGTRSATKLKENIDKAKKNPIHRLLYSLCIHHFGRKVSKLVAAEIKHVLELKDWTLERYTQIKDVGPVVAENVIKFFADEKNIALLEELESLGVNLTQTDDDIPKAFSGDGVFAGKTILFTGTLLLMGRKEAQEKAEAAGAKNASSVSSNLNILVVGTDAGSKLKKAQQIGTVQILTEEEFVAMVR
jgi:DNA ligase (NAD+)